MKASQPFLLYSFITFWCMLCQTSAGQDRDSLEWQGMKLNSYNWRRVSFNGVSCPEFTITAIHSMDYTSDSTDEDIPGNIRHDMSYGFGMGFIYRIRYDNKGTSSGFGVKAIYYPNTFVKVSATFEAEILGLGNSRFNFFIVPAVDLIYSSSVDFKRHEWHYHLSAIRMNIYKFSLTWSFQSPFRNGKIDTDFDDSFSILDLTYHLSF